MKMFYRSLLIYLLLAFGLGACQADKKPSFQELPIYPNAQRIPSKKNDTEWLRTITFQTGASLQAVQNFYQTELPKHGWQFEGKSDSNFGYFYPNHDGSPNYTLHLRVVFLSSENNQMVVMIDQLIVEKDVNVGINP